MSKIVENENGEIWVGSEKFSILLPEDQILARIKELGTQISEDYVGKLPIFIGVLLLRFLLIK